MFNLWALFFRQTWRQILDGFRLGVVPSAKMADLSRSPEDLATEAGLPVDVYSLARNVASEHPSGTIEEQTAIAEAARNKAAQRGWTITELLTTGSQHNGRYGSQLGHWASTAKDPTPMSIEAAWNAYNGSQVARGATDYYDPRDQRILHEKNPDVYRQSPEDYDRNKEKEGLVWIGEVDGIDENRLKLFATPMAIAMAKASGGGGVLTVIALIGAAIGGYYAIT